MTDVGERNIDFVKSYIQLEGLRIAAEDMGGTQPRKVDLLSGERALQAAQAAAGREPHHQSPRAVVPRQPRATRLRTAATSICSNRRNPYEQHHSRIRQPPQERRIKVLIVDDSALVRSLLTDILRADPGIEVVGVASDAHIAREKIKALNPDVLTLDVEMPKMDGITFLKNLMRLRPMPVVMVSSLTERGADVTLDALALGAVDYLSKPKIDLAATLKDYGDELIDKIRAASQGERARARSAARRDDHAPRRRTAPTRCCPRLRRRKQLRTTDRIIAIGASTGRHRGDQGSAHAAAAGYARAWSLRNIFRRPSAARSPSA